MQNPKISIMTLAHNCQEFLPEAISSIQQQTFADWELLIINDGSSDDTPEIARVAAAKDERIRYIRNEENIGIPRSRNRALEEACGEYIAVLDGDDIWLDKRKLEKQVKFLDSHPEYGVVAGQGTYIDNAGTRKGEKRVVQTDRIIRLFMPFSSQIINSSSMFRTELAREIGGYDNSFVQSEDYELWLAIGEISKLYNLQDKIVGYRVHGKNASIIERRKQLEKSAEALSTHPSFAPRLIMKTAYELKKIYVKFLAPVDNK